MWKLTIAEGQNGPYLYSTNNYVGRQIWKFDANGGTIEERAETEKARQQFWDNRHKVKPNSDLLWRKQVYNFFFCIVYVNFIILRANHNIFLLFSKLQTS